MSLTPTPWPVADGRQPLDQHQAESDLFDEANATAGLAALGLVAGVVVTKLVDLAIGGPGLLVMVGL